MSLSWFLQLMSLYVVLSADICDGAVPPCYDNWFGSPCRYQCHCASGDTCNKITGECTEQTTCEKGWFGPSCQYVDLVITNTSLTPAWVYDYPDTLCNPGQDTVTITLTDEFYFTWLRLHSNVTVSSHGFKLQLISLDGSYVQCSNVSISRVSNTTVDIHCQEGVFFQQLTITGDGVRHLCSVQISGGRNVALGQNTTQTSFYDDVHDSWLAVDGDINPSWGHGSCINTEWGDKSPSWTLTFDRPHHINRYVLYNRNLFWERLQGFILEADQENKSVAFTYTDPSKTPESIYRIQSTTLQVSVSSVTIVATCETQIGKLLALCEVEMFGDTVCPVGQYGRECENKCNCATDGEGCFVSTGGCPSGCAAGYREEGCKTPCGRTYFGVDCSEKCSTNCTDQVCQPTTGFCLSCIPGREGALCDRVCDAKWWGDNCSKPCSAACKNQLCNAVNGTCISCVAGKSGKNCDKTCSAKHYGDNCALPCSLNCTNQLCDATDGICQSCVPGKSGLYCDKVCDVTFWGDNCSMPCSAACKRQLCNAVNGTCISCIAGKSGENCDKVCNSKHYGENCVLSCSPNCTDQLCNATDGSCQSCVVGKFGLYCNKACPPTTFGQDCRETCSTNCSNNLCNSVTGKCPACGQGSAGDFCDQRLPANQPDRPAPVAAIVGPVVALVVLTALTVGCVFIRRRDSHKSPQNAVEKDCVEAGKSSAVTTKPLTAYAGQEKPSVMRKSIDCQDKTEMNPHHADHGYYNFVPRLTEALDIFSVQESSTGENLKKSPHQFKSVLASSTTASVVAGSSDYQNTDRRTNSSDHRTYEIQSASSAVTQKSQRLKSEDSLAYANYIAANMYESVYDTIPDLYENISDV